MLVRNPRYWGRAPAYLDRIVFRFLAAPFPGSGLEALHGGIVDAIFEVSPEQEVTAFCREPGVKCVTAASTGWEHIAFRSLGPGGHARSSKEQCATRWPTGSTATLSCGSSTRTAHPCSRCRTSSSCLASASTSRTGRPTATSPPRLGDCSQKRAVAEARPASTSVPGNAYRLDCLLPPASQSGQGRPTLVQTQLRQAGVEVGPRFVARRALFGQACPSSGSDLALFQLTTSPDPGAFADIWRSYGP